ncbi:MobF family relaxase [Acidithiobacillus marinus]|uniref:MobF family relaxase n=1 Tax=Acidithiobacillus marinus TaxID=187490 RepID=UPI001555FE89|nr:MobF family relaxase [Acidithiobacillus marinus]
MLNIKGLKGSSADVTAYLLANQERKGELAYFQNGEAAPSQWQGRGAHRLGLFGPIDPVVFQELLENGPAGMNVVANRRMGVDLTWSVPKGVSMLIEAAPTEQRERILQLCREANQIAMQHVEEYVVTARYGKGGAISEKTGHAIIATFEHDDTRPTEAPHTQKPKVDMDRHFHNVLINTTWDGHEWRAMDLDFGALSVNQHLGDAKAKAFLAQGLERMGIKTEHHAKALFEVVGISEAQRDLFSNRSKEIEQLLARQGKTRKNSTAAERNAANLATRKSKLRNMNHDDLRWAWRERLRDAGVDFFMIYDPAHDQTKEHESFHTTKNARQPHENDQRNEQQRYHQHRLEKLHVASTQLAASRYELRNLSECRLDAGPRIGRESASILPHYARLNRPANYPLRWKPASTAEIDAEQQPAVAAVDAALDHLSEKDSLFDYRQLHLEALRQCMGAVQTEAIEKVMASHDRIIWAGEQSKIVEQKRQGKDGLEITQKTLIRAEMVTTRETVEREGWIQGFCQEGCNKLDTLFQPDQAVRAIYAAEQAQGFAFSKDQRSAVHDVLMTQDRLVAMIGGAGAGKTTVMKSLVDVAKAQGYETIGLTPQHGACQEMAEAGTDVNITTAQFIAEKKESGSNPRLFILDEAGMVGDRTLQQVLLKMGPRDRIMLFGDPDHMQPVEAGNPLQMLMDKGFIQVSRLTAIRRQAMAEDKDLQALGQAWADRDTEKALSLMEKYTTEVQPEGTGKNKVGQTKITKEDRYRAIADATVAEYLSRSSTDQARTMVVSPTNQVRQMVNAGIRKGLQEHGSLAADQVTVTQLCKVDISEQHMTHAEYYVLGQIMRTQEGKREERHTVDYEIVGMDARKNQLKLASKHGKEKVTNAGSITGKRWQVFIKEEMGLAEGDKLVFRDNSVMKNGDTATIKGIEGNKIVVIMDRDKKEITLDATKNMAVDYGYGRSIKDIEGKSPDLVIQTGEQSQNSSRNLRLMGNNRMRYGYKLITDNAERALKRFEIMLDKNMAINARKKASEAEDRRLDQLDAVLNQGEKAGRKEADQQLYFQEDKKLAEKRMRECDIVVNQENLLGEKQDQSEKPAHNPAGRGGMDMAR